MLHPNHTTGTKPTRQQARIPESCSHRKRRSSSALATAVRSDRDPSATVRTGVRVLKAFQELWMGQPCPASLRHASTLARVEPDVVRGSRTRSLRPGAGPGGHRRGSNARDGILQRGVPRCVAVASGERPRAPRRIMSGQPRRPSQKARFHGEDLGSEACLALPYRPCHTHRARRDCLRQGGSRRFWGEVLYFMDHIPGLLVSHEPLTVSWCI